MITKILISLLLTTILTTPAWCDYEDISNYTSDDVCRAIGNDGQTTFSPSKCGKIPGCGYDPESTTNQCTPCRQGYYNSGTDGETGTGECLSCEMYAGPDYKDHTHAYGAKGIDYCYKDCQDRPVANGIAKGNGHVHYEISGTNACQYTTQCTATGYLCTSYHFPAGATHGVDGCEPNKSEVNSPNKNFKDNKGIEIFNHVTNTVLEQTYCTKDGCADGHHPVNDVSKTPIDGYTLCDTSLYTECKANSHDCNTDPNIPKSATLNGTTHNGTVSGTATWKPNTEDDYDYSKCTLTINTTNPVPNGTGTAKCTVWNGTQWTNCTYDVHTCNAGYYIKDEASAKEVGCVAVGEGYYSIADDKQRTPCPAGSTTSTKTATAFTECHLTGGVTQICDGKGSCFKLPGDDPIHLTRIPPKS